MAAWAEGQALTLEQAVAEALADEGDAHEAVQAEPGEPGESNR